MNLFKNVFVQSLGIGAVIYVILLGLDWAMIFLLGILETSSRWYRFHASP